MEKFKITLADGTELKGLWLNGNNYTGKDEVTPETFEGKLSHVTIEGDSGSVTELNNAELVQIEKCEEGWRFILREKAELTTLIETLRAKLEQLGE